MESQIHKSVIQSFSFLLCFKIVFRERVSNPGQLAHPVSIDIGIGGQDSRVQEGKLKLLPIDTLSEMISTFRGKLFLPYRRNKSFVILCKPCEKQSRSRIVKYRGGYRATRYIRIGKSSIFYFFPREIRAQTKRIVYLVYKNISFSLFYYASSHFYSRLSFPFSFVLFFLFLFPFSFFLFFFSSLAFKQVSTIFMELCVLKIGEILDFLFTLILEYR